MTADAGLQEIMGRYVPSSPGAVASVDAGLHVEVGRVAAEAAAREMARYRHRFDWDQVRPFELPTSKGSTAAGAITLTDETWGPRTGRVWDFRRITVAGLSAGNATPLSQTGEGAVTNPGAFATIAATSSLPPGTYSISATVYVSGTVTTVDANNMELFGAGISSTVKIAYPGVANSPGSITAILSTTGTGAIGVQSITAASGASAVYNAQLVVTPVAVLPDAVTVYKVGAAVAGGAQLQTAIDVVSGAAAAGTVGNALYTAKGALILQHGDYIAVAGTVASAQVIVSGAGIDVRIDCLPDYLA